MKKVLFIDEMFYRFSHYYENINWWKEHAINPTFKHYEKKVNKYYIYLNLVFNKPDFIVIVQLSTKNLILIRIANLLGIKVIFWQHGIFEYPINKNRKLNLLKLNLYKLLALSEHDTNGISDVFSNVESSEVIPHYDLAYLNYDVINNNKNTLSIAYLGQIVTPQQVKESGAKVMERYLGKKDIFNAILEEIELKVLPINVIAKKHPGDKSTYLDNLSKRYEFFSISDNDDVYTCDIAISYFSTLMLAFIELNKTVIQLPMTNGDYRIDMACYDKKGSLYQIDTKDDFLAFLSKYKPNKTIIDESKYNSISERLALIINE
jgi:hypothetical protein